jgi:hypothetical protein
MRRPQDPALAPERDSRAQPAADTGGPQASPTRPEIGGDPALVEALKRCAARDVEGLDELRAWQGGRLHETLLRMLGDAKLADRALDATLADLWENAGIHDALGRGPAEDRVFALLRRHARAVMREGDLAAPVPMPSLAPSAPTPADMPLPPVIPADRPPPLQAPAGVVGVPAPAGSPPQAVDDPLAGVRRLRRPGTSIPAPIPLESELHAEPKVRRPGRRWPLLVLLWLLAAGGGFGLTFLALGPPPDRDFAELRSPPAEAPLPATPEPAIPAPSDAALAGLPPVETAKPSLQELIGEPLVAREPSMTLRPEDPALAITPAAPAPVPAARPVVEAALPQGLRVFIHFSGGNARATAQAQALEQTLRQRGADVIGMVPVQFPIGRASVRYFHPEDQVAAIRLLGTARDRLAAGGQAPLAPSDFTTFRPSPRPGTLEVWLAGG